MKREHTKIILKMHYLSLTDATKNAQNLPEYHRAPYYYCSKSRVFYWILDGTEPAAACHYCKGDTAQNHFLEVPAWHWRPKLQAREYIYQVLTAPGSAPDQKLFTYLNAAGIIYTRTARARYYIISRPDEFANIKINIL